jgi:hypothetical protein
VRPATRGMCDPSPAQPALGPCPTHIPRRARHAGLPRSPKVGATAGPRVPSPAPRTARASSARPCTTASTAATIASCRGPPAAPMGGTPSGPPLQPPRARACAASSCAAARGAASCAKRRWYAAGSARAARRRSVARAPGHSSAASSASRSSSSDSGPLAQPAAQPPSPPAAPEQPSFGTSPPSSPPAARAAAMAPGSTCPPAASPLPPLSMDGCAAGPGGSCGCGCGCGSCGSAQAARSACSCCDVASNLHSGHRRRGAASVSLPPSPSGPDVAHIRTAPGMPHPTRSLPHAPSPARSAGALPVKQGARESAQPRGLRAAAQHQRRRQRPPPRQQHTHQRATRLARTDTSQPFPGPYKAVLVNGNWPFASHWRWQGEAAPRRTPSHQPPARTAPAPRPPARTAR